MEWERRTDLPPRFAETIACQRMLNEDLWSPRDRKHATVTAFGDDVSRLVAQQYEEHPYPSWTRVNLPVEGGILAQLRRLRSAAGLASTHDAPRVLVAGCGTGQQAVTIAAALGPSARLLAIDLSAASLDCARAKADEHGVGGSIEFRQADILSLGTLHETFDIIYCTGVLHHMADPLAGWRALIDRLKPGGSMRIALYSAAARAPLDALKKRFPPDETLPMEARIRNFRRRVLAAYAHDWTASGLMWHDFFTLGGCRDLLFHAHERRFTIPQLEAALEELGLIFLEPEGLADWAEREAKNPLAFASMYQFWCAKIV
jgi:SAM-dependent methyltransferase